MSPSFIFPSSNNINQNTNTDEEPQCPPPDDRLDPLNWSSWIKLAVLFQVSVLGFIGPFSQYIMTTAYEPVAEAMTVTSKEASYSTPVAIILAGVAPLIYAPLSSVYGRRPVYLAGPAIGIAASAGYAACTSWEPFIIARAVVGIGSSVGMGIGASVVSDLYFVHQRGLFMGVYMLFVTNGVYLAILVGAFVERYATWRWCYWIPTIILGASWVVNIFGLPETLYRRGLVSHEKERSWMRLLNFMAVSAERLSIKHLAGCIYMLKNPSIFLTALYYSIAFAAGATLTTLTAITTFQKIYHFTTPQTALAISLPALTGSILGEFLSGRMSDTMLSISYSISLATLPSQTTILPKTPDPETRLQATYPGAIFLPIGLLIQGLSFQFQTHWAVPVTGIGISAFGLQIVSTPILSYLVDSYDTSAGEVSAMANFGRCMVAFSVEFWVLPLVQKTGFGVSFGVIAAVCVVLYTGVVVVIWRGAAWRGFHGI